MNLPQSQVTGAATESAVEHLFLSWGWNVGHDRIDDGYDLHVTPDRNIYQGFHFSVQVKGTVKNKPNGLISAQVTKSRLRQYAEGFAPVFIIRATGDGSLYWIHAQHWAQANKNKITGNGRSAVKFEASKKLINRNDFEKYLSILFKSPPYRDSTPSASLHESFYLNTLDPHLQVKIVNGEHGKTHEVYATNESVISQMSFLPITSEGNIKNLREAIEFGLPRSVEVEKFNLSGSPLLDHIFEGSLKGTLSIKPTKGTPATVKIIPGRKISITSNVLSLKVERFNGAKGGAFTNERLDRYIDFAVQFPHDIKNLSASINIQLGDLNANNTPAREIDFLRDLGNWADQLIAKDCFSIEIAIHGTQLQVLFSPKFTDEFRDFVLLSEAVSKIHLIAKSTNSGFVFPSDFEITGTELQEIDFAYSVLKGESRDICLGTMEVTLREGFDINNCQGMDLLVTTIFQLEIFGQTLCRLPISIELINFQLDTITNTGKLKLTQGSKGIARASYNEDHDK